MSHRNRYPDSPVQQLIDGYNSIPLVTRTLMTLALVVSVVAGIELVKPMTLILLPQRIYSDFEVFQY
jgi:hypothetical protein